MSVVWVELGVEVAYSDSIPRCAMLHSAQSTSPTFNSCFPNPLSSSDPVPSGVSGSLAGSLYFLPTATGKANAKTLLHLRSLAFRSGPFGRLTTAKHPQCLRRKHPSGCERGFCRRRVSAITMIPYIDIGKIDFGVHSASARTVLTTLGHFTTSKWEGVSPTASLSTGDQT